MRPRDRRITLLIAVPGTVLCAAAVFGFFRKIIGNQLPWADGSTAPAHYLAVGRSFSLGFAAGFFLCFFLAITAIAISAWARARRSRLNPGSTPVPARRREDTAELPPGDAHPEATPYPAASRR